MIGRLTKRFPRLVTGRRTTPGVIGNTASSPLSLPEEMWRSLVPSDKLSLRELGLRIGTSFEK